MQTYDPKHNNFTPKLQSYIEAQQDPYNISFYCAAELNNDRMLFGTKRGLLIYNKGKDAVIALDTLSSNSKRDPYSYNTHVLDMKPDNIDRNIIWLLTRMGLFKFEIDKLKATPIPTTIPINFLDNSILEFDLEVLQNEVIIRSNYFELYTYDKITKKWTHLNEGSSRAEKKENIRNVIVVEDQFALLPFINKGIYGYSKSKGLHKIKTDFKDDLVKDEFSHSIIDHNGYLLSVNRRRPFMRSKNKLIEIPQKFKLVPTALRVNDLELRNIDFSNITPFENYQRNIQVQLAIDYPDPELNYQSQYKWNDSPWQAVPADRWVRLPKGNPELNTLKTRLEFDREKVDQVITSFEIKKYFYEQNWFKLLVSGVVLALVALFYWQAKMRKRDKVLFDKKLLDLQMNALRSQMNPHFLFNSLNSIKNYVVSRGPDEASDYLTKFSQLIRSILENSRQHFISLEKEIETLSLYIEMEQKRFNDKFDFKIGVDPEIDQSNFMIAPMILQPYVENAIWHGFDE